MIDVTTTQSPLQSTSKERVGKEDGDGLLKEDTEIYISASERAALVGSQQRLQQCRSGKMKSVIFSHREMKLKYATKQEWCILVQWCIKLTRQFQAEVNEGHKGPLTLLTSGE